MKPLFFRSLLNSSEIFVFEGTSVHFFQWFCFGFPSTKLQRYESKVPNSFCTTLNAFAFFTADWIFNLFLTIEASSSSCWSFPLSYSATFWKSKLSNAFLYPSLFLSIVDQLRPACADSSNKNSNSLLSLWTGTAHSLSWYSTSVGVPFSAHLQRTFIWLIYRSIFMQIFSNIFNLFLFFSKSI